MLVKILVGVSIITTLLVMGASVYDPARQSNEVECRSQLLEIGRALEDYRLDHEGQDPPGGLTGLVPEYLRERALICPLNRTRAPKAVAEAQRIMTGTPFRYWCSYFYFRQVALDRLLRAGRIRVGYRLGETPVAVCFDHREPWSLRYKGLTTPQMERAWYHPERPQIVLRRNIGVEAVRYGGVSRDGAPMDTDAYLLEL